MQLFRGRVFIAEGGQEYDSKVSSKSRPKIHPAKVDFPVLRGGNVKTKEKNILQNNNFWC